MLLPPQAANPVDLGGRIVPGGRRDRGRRRRASCSRTRRWTTASAFSCRCRSISSAAWRLREAAQECGKPVVMVCTPGAAADPARQELRKMGWIVYDSFEQALRVLALVAEYDRLRGRAVERPSRPSDLPPPESLRDMRAGAADRARGQDAARVVRPRRGARGLRASPEKRRRRRARPWGSRSCSSWYRADIVHKSDVGAVQVGLRDKAELLAAATHMQERVRAALPNARIEGCSVQETGARRSGSDRRDTPRRAVRAGRDGRPGGHRHRDPQRRGRRHGAGVRGAGARA